MTDKRANKKKLGTSRNGIYLRTGEARTYDDVASWIGQNVANELAAAGIQRCGDGPRTVLAVDIQLHRVFVDEFWNLRGTISGHVTVQRDGRVVSTKKIVAHHKQTSHAGSASEFTDALYRTALRFRRQVRTVVVDATVLKKEASAAVASGRNTGFSRND